jgi:hypothetical protein
METIGKMAAGAVFAMLLLVGFSSYLDVRRQISPPAGDPQQPRVDREAAAERGSSRGQVPIVAPRDDRDAQPARQLVSDGAGEGAGGSGPRPCNGEYLPDPSGGGEPIGCHVSGNAPVWDGACVDFDPRSTHVDGPYETLFRSATAQRVRMTGDGSYVGEYPASVYWTSC